MLCHADARYFVRLSRTVRHASTTTYVKDYQMPAREQELAD